MYTSFSGWHIVSFCSRDPFDSRCCMNLSIRIAAQPNAVPYTQQTVFYGSWLGRKIQPERTGSENFLLYLRANNTTPPETTSGEKKQKHPYRNTRFAKRWNGVNIWRSYSNTKR